MIIRPNRIMISAYLSAMILSGLGQVGGTNILASALNPQAAQRVFHSVLASMNSAGISAVASR